MLPAGSTLDRSTLTIDGPSGSGKVGADGSFSIEVNDGPTLVVASEPGGKLVLLGFLHDGATELSARSTAEVLLYYALGAFTVPGDSFEAVVTAVVANPQAAALGPSSKTGSRRHQPCSPTGTRARSRRSSRRETPSSRRSLPADCVQRS